MELDVTLMSTPETSQTEIYLSLCEVQKEELSPLHRQWVMAPGRHANTAVKLRRFGWFSLMKSETEMIVMQTSVVGEGSERDGGSTLDSREASNLRGGLSVSRWLQGCY